MLIEGILTSHQVIVLTQCFIVILISQITLGMKLVLPATTTNTIALITNPITLGIEVLLLLHVNHLHVHLVEVSLVVVVFIIAIAFC